MAGIDRTVMTEEAIALRKGEFVEIEGVRVKFSERERLIVHLPEGMTGEQCDKWLHRNAARMGYIPVDRENLPESRSPRKPVKSNEDFEPLQPYTEE